MSTWSILANVLKKPFPFTKRKWLLILGCTIADMIFIFLFTPLTLIELSGSNLLFLKIGLALILFCVLTLFELILPRVLPEHIPGKCWTLGKQIFWSSVIIIISGVLCYYYTNIFIDFSNDKSGREYRLLFLLYTSVIGFVVLLFVLAIKVILYLRDLRHVETLTESSEKDGEKNNDCGSFLLDLRDENKNTRLNLCLRDLYYLESEGNYINVFFQRGGKVRQISFRGTLKQQLEVNAQAINLIRCHRAYAVNIGKIENITGNSRSMRLLLKECDKEIPIARNYVSEIKELVKDEMYIS